MIRLITAVMCQTDTFLYRSVHLTLSFHPLYISMVTHQFHLASILVDPYEAHSTDILRLRSPFFR